MKHTLITSLSVILLSGCTLSPDYTRPIVESPSQWSSQQTQTTSMAAYDWWTGFKSEELNALIAQGLENNTDINAGVRRIEQARASLKIAGASLLPNIDGSANVSRSKNNPESGQTSYNSNLGLGVSVAYELDLFGANRANIDSASAGYQASLYDQESLKLSLMGDVAVGYFTLLNLHERLKIANNNLENGREILRIIRARVREGVESDLELSQQKSAVASVEATRVSIIEQIKNAENALALLLGKPPQSVFTDKKELDGITIPAIASGQPSDLLERRPDLLSAEQDLRAANADIGAARAAFFPSITLGLSDSVSIAGFGDPSSTALGISSSLIAPIFSAGRLDASLDQVTARQLELVEIYKGSVLTAFQEVENALAAVSSAQDREIALKTTMEQARLAYTLSKKRYDAGSIDYQTLLDTQNAQLSAEDTYAQARLARLTSAVNLFKALGGGWVS